MDSQPTPSAAAVDFNAAIEIGERRAQLLPDVPGHKRYLAVPQDAKVHELARLKLQNPRFLTAQPVFNDVAPFIAYVNCFKDAATRIFYNDKGEFVAVIDHHAAIGQVHQERAECVARHGDHLAKLHLIRSPEWLKWAVNNEKPMDQQTCGEFIEDNLRDIQGDPQLMLDVASGLHATVGAEFRGALNLANGSSELRYDETVSGTVKGRTEAVPTQFSIALRPFMGCDRYPIDCRFRYRVNGGALRLHYKALHLEVITEAAIEGVLTRIATETQLVPGLGTHDEKAFKLGE